MNSCSSLYLKTSNVLVFTFNFFGEFDPVRVCEWSRLLINVVDVQHFTHELNDRLGLVKSSGRHYKERMKHRTDQYYNSNYVITESEQCQCKT